MDAESCDAAARLAQDDIVEIPATDLARAAAFYQRVFNFNVEHCTDGTYRFSTGTTGEPRIAVVTPKGSGPGPHGICVYKVASVEDTAARVHRYGGTVLVVTTDAKGARISLCRDTEGNQLSIEQSGA